MIIVTGGAGFIGNNLIRGLNEKGHDDILVVDDLTDGTKFRNLVGCQFKDYWDTNDLSAFIMANELFPEKVDAIFHQGACTNTMEWDGRYMMQNNYVYSKNLLHYCMSHAIPFIYASSASVYGTGRIFKEINMNESPINVYGYSKYLFDEYVRRVISDAKTRIIGLRYFNVYGPREQHKQTMASVAFHFNQQLLTTGCVKLFKGSGDYADGEQRRDFIFVNDVVAVNLWCLNHTEITGIYNVGTGKSRSFNDLARAIIAWHGRGEISYIDMPAHLKNSYQSFTEADTSALRKSGYQHEFLSLEDGIKHYLNWLNASERCKED
ncbi:MAG: ADP-glyceromanno-heptose 6-epimerase [Gammaproteobacteria bacterium]|nr:ADP-glyceromanno-heptose 6-epimerase [Gammaproteobacteria bacterium]